MTKDGRPDAQNGETSPPASPCADLPPGPTEPVRPTKKTCTPNCHCPTTPPPSETCFDKLIAAQAEELKKAELAQKFKAELEVLLKQATAARLAYTQDKYVDFQKRWEAADKEIASATSRSPAPATRICG